MQVSLQLYCLACYVLIFAAGNTIISMVVITNCSIAALQILLGILIYQGHALKYREFQTRNYSGSFCIDHTLAEPCGGLERAKLSCSVLIHRLQLKRGHDTLGCDLLSLTSIALPPTLNILHLLVQLATLDLLGDDYIVQVFVRRF